LLYTKIYDNYQTNFLVAHFAKQNTKFGGGGKRGQGGIPHTPPFRRVLGQPMGAKRKK